MSDTDDGETDDRLDALHEHLAATAERPVARAASAHLGEAEAVARDLAERPAEPETVRERAGHVVRLLREAGDTEDETADEHVAAALEIARELAGDDDPA
ncbi:hypothetical protein [Halobaculum magnesiiphilum]|uniref:DUF8152 domain-containing protein n=1 Tax=Halobaculum magnesiiphilum TaxID=1017351 RepID=A0A8T8WA87_9EURY|nr:hypothetical protein [Halobaculum magnesiiphilum]QZP36738.1 hypothetical protein K6T50_10520 [Halobaculum magnesiiphilum]